MTTANQATLGALLDRKGHDIFSIGPNDSVYDAIARMSDHGVGALLVMDEGRLLGIVSERDYTRKVILQGRASRETRVAEIMTPNVVTAPPGMLVSDAMRLMSESRIRHLPIVQDQTVTGVVSIGDLVKWVISAQADTINQLQNYITGSYMS